MPYEWDERKRRENRDKHELDFADADSFDWDTALKIPSPRYGEMRWLAIGYIGLRLYAIVYTERGDNIRIISFRKASRQEVRDYAEA